MSQQLERSRVNIIPCRPLNKDRYVVEAYPALVARRYIGRSKYKSDARRHQTPAREDARRELLGILQGPRLEEDFGLTLDAQQALHVESLVAFECFDTFENFLGSPGPWIAGMDFPFGQPQKLRRNLGWPECWGDIARLVGDMSRAEFERVLTEYRDARVPGLPRKFSNVSKHSKVTRLSTCSCRSRSVAATQVMGFPRRGELVKSSP